LIVPPLIRDLPDHLRADGWEWSKAEPPANHFPGLGVKHGWWFGTDENGIKWLTKLTGGSYAYREHVFSALAQSLGISCQSSVYVTIPKDAAPMRDKFQAKRFQLALWYYAEHANDPCKTQCPMDELTSFDLSYLDSGIKYAEDMIRGEFLGYLCGQSEPAGYLFTANHEFIQIDNEQMFGGDPGNLENCYWWKFDAARKYAFEVCRKIAELSEAEILKFAEIPKGYVIVPKNGIPIKLKLLRRAAIGFLNTHPLPS
jgi:hypothetical protein